MSRSYKFHDPEGTYFISFATVEWRERGGSVITNWLGKHGLRQVQYMAGHRFISSIERYQVGQIKVGYLSDLQSDLVPISIGRLHPSG